MRLFSMKNTPATGDIQEEKTDAGPNLTIGM
jgi:hypothetical protein